MSAPEQPRRLIVNADDFGLTSGINRGIIEAHERGIVTSASLMVRYPSAAEAASYARTHSDLSVGLHFEAAEWRYRDGDWYPAYIVVDTNDLAAIEAELDRQLEEFERLVGQAPTHLDSHQHVHQSEPARSILLERARRVGLPLRSCSPAVGYCGGFYGQTAEGDSFPAGITVARLTELMEALPAGCSELGCHPGYVDGLDSVYLSEREQELRVLCSREARDCVGRLQIQLVSFRDIARAKEPAREASE